MNRYKHHIAIAYNSKDVIDACKNIGGCNWEDIRGEVVAKLLELPNEKLEKIKDFKAYIIRSCYYSAIDISRKFKNITFVELPKEMQHPRNEEQSIIFQKILKDYDNKKRFYHARVFIGVQYYGSVKAFSRVIGIPYNELGKVYKEYKEYLYRWQKSHI